LGTTRPDIMYWVTIHNTDAVLSKLVTMRTLCYDTPFGSTPFDLLTLLDISASFTQPISH
jgi:hypothetical protein